jgi:DNA polymerase-3 subunit delta
MDNIFYFTGENVHAVREEQSLWESRFMSKHGAENLLRLSSVDMTYRVLLDEISSAPFIAEKRLVVVTGTPSFSKEEVELLPRSIHPDCILVFVDARPDKRLASVKALQKISTLKEFPLLKGAALRQWALQMANDQQSTLDNGAWEALVGLVGEDQDMLTQEISKLCLFASGRSITRQDVEKICIPSGEQEIWTLTSLFAERRRLETLRYARQLQDRGEDPYSVWSILLWMLRSILLVTAAAKDGERNIGTIVSKTHVSFQTVRQLLPLTRNTSVEKLSSIVCWAADAERDLKTGGYRATKEKPQELAALIDRLIFLCTEVQVA